MRLLDDRLKPHRTVEANRCRNIDCGQRDLAYLHESSPLECCLAENGGLQGSATDRMPEPPFDGRKHAGTRDRERQLGQCGGAVTGEDILTGLTFRAIHG